MCVCVCVCVCDHSSQATNPSQFETDVEVTWRKCQQSGENIFHVGRVGINTEKPEESLDVHGNLRVTGNVYKQSDERVKQNIQAVRKHELGPKTSSVYRTLSSHHHRANTLQDLVIIVL